MVGRLFTAIGFVLTCSSPLAAQDMIVRSASLVGIGGKGAGQVVLTDAPQGVLLHIEASGLTPGWHAIHLHDKADCTDPAFKSAGSHVHPMATANAVHGLLNPATTDDGDLPNIFATADGHATAEIFSSRVALRAGTLRADLLDTDGSALIIHANPDDYRSQPIGGAGARVACAAIR